MLERTLYLGILAFLCSGFGISQGLSPSTPSKEYIRLNGQVVAVENAAPGGGSGASDKHTSANKQTKAAPAAKKAKAAKSSAPATNHIP